MLVLLKDPPLPMPPFCTVACALHPWKASNAIGFQRTIFLCPACAAPCPALLWHSPALTSPQTPNHPPPQQGLGDDDAVEASSATLMETEEGFQPGGDGVRGRGGRNGGREGGVGREGGGKGGIVCTFIGQPVYPSPRGPPPASPGPEPPIHPRTLVCPSPPPPPGSVL